MPKRGRKPTFPFCTVPGCGRPHAAKGLCAAHYKRKWRGGPLDADVPVGGRYGPRDARELCSTPGCTEKHLAGGLCRKCYDAPRKNRSGQRRPKADA